MSNVKDAMKLIKETRAIVNIRYDMSMKNIIEIKNQSNNFFDLINNGFIFGYAQGMKAAKAEMKKGGGSNG